MESLGCSIAIFAVGEFEVESFTVQYIPRLVLSVMAAMCNDRGLSFLDDDGQTLNLNMDRSFTAFKRYITNLEEIKEKTILSKTEITQCLRARIVRALFITNVCSLTFANRDTAWTLAGDHFKHSIQLYHD